VIRATLAQTNYFILQKNLLLGDKSPGVIDFVRHMVGLPAGEPATPFLVALAGRPGFSAKALMAELYHDRKLIKAPLMRHTDYVVDASQFVEFFAATTRQRNQGFNAEFRQWGIESNDEIENLGATILNVIGDPKLQRLIFDRAGGSRPTILLTGQVVGLWAWRLEDGQASIDWQLLVELDSTREGQIQAELEAMGRLIQPRAQLHRSRN
jgi:hypothetical protein